MILIINGIPTLYNSLNLTISINNIARELSFAIKEILPSHKIGDKVIVNYGKDLFVGEIEKIECSNGSYTYAGRNNAKYLIDAYADKTIQFNKHNTINKVYNDFASKYGLKVIGDAKLGKEADRTLNIGDNLIDKLLEYAQEAGKIVYSDAQGNLHIGFNADGSGGTVKEFEDLNYSEEQTYSKYVVASQKNGKYSFDYDIKGEFGKGKRVKVIVANNGLDKAECEKLAETEHKKDIRRSFNLNLKTFQFLEINKTYNILDVRVKETLNCKNIDISIDEDNFTILADFERVV